jgi:acetoin utilization deacetylase AcuC-like enzyme
MRKNTIKVHYTPKQVLAKDSGGNFSKSPLKPKRLLENFETEGLGEHFTIVEDFTPYTNKDFKIAHTKRYVNSFFSGQKGCESNGLDWSTQFADSVRYTNASLHAAIRGSIIEPDQVHFSPTSGFHHARPDGGSGFCTFSGQVIASIKILEEFGLSGAYLDLDGHFGNSIEDSREFVKDLDKAVPTEFNINPTGKGLAYVNNLKWNLQNLEEAILTGQIGYVVWCHGADSHEWDDLGFQCSTEHWLECSTIFWNWVKSMDKKLGRPLPVSCALFGGYRKDDYQSVLSLHTADFVECMNNLLSLEVKYTIKVQPKYSYSHGKAEYVR